jgi:hypothetical protein
LVPLSITASYTPQTDTKVRWTIARPASILQSDTGHTYTFTRRPDGTTDLDAVVVREGNNIKGRVLGFVLGIFGERLLGRELAKTVKAIEAPERQVESGETPLNAMWRTEIR